MAKSWSKEAAFASFGAACKNSRWSWSGRSADGKTVVLTLWRDEFDYGSSPVSYDCFGRATAAWSDRPGNRERLENLVWARDHCDGMFRIVVAVAEDVNANPRRIASCAPQPNMIMRVVKLDEKTGEFRAELVGDSRAVGL